MPLSVKSREALAAVARLQCMSELGGRHVLALAQVNPALISTKPARSHTGLGLRNAAYLRCDAKRMIFTKHEEPYPPINQFRHYWELPDASNSRPLNWHEGAICA